MTELVLHSLKFKRWKERIESSGNHILKVDILSVVSRQAGSFYAAFLDCLLLTPEGTRIPRCVVLRGESVLVIPVLRCTDDDTLYTLMVEQRCICDGSMHVGFPAGNADEMGADFAAMACGEIKEELGLDVEPADLVPLGEEGVFINPSITDDLVRFYYFTREVSSEWLAGIDSRSTGCHGEGEFIRVRVRKISDAAGMKTTSSLVGLRLLERALGVVF